MTPLIDKISSYLRTNEKEKQEEALDYIITLFDKKSGVPPEAWVLNNNQEVANEVFTKAKEQVIKSTLCNFIDSNLNNSLAVSAVFALGKAYDKKLKSYFIKLLEYYLSNDASILYQVLIALDNIENLENRTIFGQEGGSIIEEHRNIELAKKYLNNN